MNAELSEAMDRLTTTALRVKRERDTFLALTSEARELLQRDRDSLYDGVVNVSTDEIEDEEDRAAVAEYDVLLGKIDRALAAAKAA